MTAHSYLNYEHAPGHPYMPNVRFVNVFNKDDEEFIGHLQQNYGDRWSLWIRTKSWCTKERLFEKWVSVEPYTPEMYERTFYREAVRHILEDTIKTIESISLVNLIDTWPE